MEHKTYHDLALLGVGVGASTSGVRFLAIFETNVGNPSILNITHLDPQI